MIAYSLLALQAERRLICSSRGSHRDSDRVVLKTRGRRESLTVTAGGPMVELLNCSALVYDLAA